MNISIRTKFLVLCIVLVLVTTAGISATYYVLAKQDKQRESRQRIQIAFDIILNDFTERITTYTTRANKFLEENVPLLWATYNYSLDDSEEGTIKFLFDHFADVSEELRQFGRVALADRVSLYGSNKRLLVLYQRQNEQEITGSYLLSKDEGGRYLPMDDLSIRAELTFRKNNLSIHAQNKPLPDTPLPPGVKVHYEGDIPTTISVSLFREGQQLGIKIIAPIYRRENVMGLLVGEVFYTQDMVEEYATLSKTEVNFFAENQLSAGTLREQVQLASQMLLQSVLCQDILNGNKEVRISPVTLGKRDYYQGQCVFKHAQSTVGAITVSLSQSIEKRELGRILQAVFMVSGIGIILCIGLVSWIVVPKFTGPIITLTNTALQMARGDLQQAIDISGKDELGSLAQSFAYMRDEIQQKIEELQQLNAELDQRVERRTAELVRQQYILDTFMATVPDRIYFKDCDGRVTRANMAHTRRMGLQHPDEEVGKTDFDFFSEEEARHRYGQEQEIIRSGIPLIGVEEKRVWPDGQEEWSLVTKMPLRDEHDAIIGVFGISRDISTLKQTEETLKHAKEAAETANRAKAEFLANMNHELRTPLNVILGLTQIMARNPDIPIEERDNLTIIYRSGELLLTLISNVLDLSKIEAGRMVLYENNVDLFRLLEELEEMFSLKTAQKRLNLEVERAEDVPQYVYTDGIKLRQILMNLLNNATKFTEEGGISVRVESLHSSPPPNPSQEGNLAASPREKLPLEEGGRGVFSTLLSFEISDTGPGIAPEEIASIFEAFRQTQTGRQAQEGTGLGLTISQKFAQLLGGEISVQSQLGHGTTFRFTIPSKAVRAIDIPSVVPDRKIIALTPGQPRYRVLIVDDKHSNRDVLLKLLLPFGFDVQEAANGQEAVMMRESFQPHLIWMDMRMPVLDGYEATKRIRRAEGGAQQNGSTSRTAIIALTASSSEEEREAVLSVGCDDFLRKPFREEKIFMIMQKHLGVQYVYEGGEEQRVKTEHPMFEKVLTASALLALPQDLYSDLQRASDVTDPEMVHALTGRIREHDILLANALEELTKQFRFDILQQIFEEIDV